jgi:hypothetical protein
MFKITTKPNDGLQPGCRRRPYLFLYRVIDERFDVRKTIIRWPLSVGGPRRERPTSHCAVRRLVSNIHVRETHRQSQIRCILEDDKDNIVANMRSRRTGVQVAKKNICAYGGRNVENARSVVIMRIYLSCIFPN